MTEEEIGAWSARIGVVETMLAWLVSDMIKRSGGDQATLEAVRVAFSTAAPQPLAVQHEARMRAFRKEWDLRMDQFFDAVTSMMGRKDR